MVIFVTGSKGLIGTRCFELYTGNCDLISVDLPDGFDILNRKEFFAKANQALTNIENVSDQVPVIVHLAAFTDVSGAYDQSGDKDGLCYRLNVEGTENVIHLANQLGAHLVHISTDFVFDGDKQNSYSEEDQPNPIEWYGETKLIAEERVRRDSESWTIMRIAFPYHKKPGVRPDLVAKIREKLAAGEQLFLFGDQIITPTFADDVARAIFAFTEHKPHQELFHVMGPESYSPYQLGVKLAEIDSCDASLITETSLIDYLKQDPRPRQKRLAMSTSKYRQFCSDKQLVAPRILSESLAEP